MKFGAVSTLLVYGILRSAQVLQADSFLLTANGGFTRFVVPGAAPGESFALGINNREQIVGSFRDPCAAHGFLRDPNGVFTQNDFPDASSSGVNGINDAGQMVGSYQDTFSGGAFYFDANGEFTTIAGGGSSAMGINNVGQIVGTRGISFLYDLNSGTFLDFGDPSTVPFGINNVGQIVGQYMRDSSGVLHGFLKIGSNLISIDGPGGTGSMIASGINDAGRIIGTDFTGNQPHAFLYVNGVYTAIVIPGSAGSYATRINNAGDVVGFFTPSPVPEPNSMTMIGFGLVAIALNHRTKKPK
jgi:probable HAF family extracellular repeat protein